MWYCNCLSLFRNRLVQHGVELGTQLKLLVDHELQIIKMLLGLLIFGSFLVAHELKLNQREHMN